MSFASWASGSGRRPSGPCFVGTVSDPPRGGRAPPGPSSSGLRPRASWGAISSQWRPIRLKTLYVLFFIELGSRRVTVARVSGHPDSAWVTQQARNLAIARKAGARPARFLIHDRDSKFSGPFDEVFRTEGTEVILTPIRAPKANAYAERWVETVRAECLDHVLVLGRRHLERILGAYVDHYNRARPHRGLALAVPDPTGVERVAVRPRDVRRRTVLGGLINEYHGAAA